MPDNETSLTASRVADHLCSIADPEVAEKYLRYFKSDPGEYASGDTFLGIRMPVLRQLSRQFSALPLEENERLLSSGLHEARLLALLIMVLKFSAGNALQRWQIYSLYLANTVYINNWDLVDCSAHLIVGPYLEDKSHDPLFNLASSELLWDRRIAVMATFHFIRQGQFETTLDLLEILLSDQEDLVHKACGWMLREVGNRDLAREETFLQVHYRQMPRTMLRYAIEKLPADKRKAYLQGKI